MRSMEGAVQLIGSDTSPIIAEAELWERRAGMEPGGMGADPAKSIAGLRRIIKDPSITPRESAVAAIMLARLRRKFPEV